MRMSGQVHRLSQTKMEQQVVATAGDAGCAAVASSSNGDPMIESRKRMKLAVVKDTRKSRRPKDAVPALKLPGSGKRRAVKRKRSDEDEDEDVDANEAKTEMDAARALMGILNFGLIPSPSKSKSSIAIPRTLSWLSTRRRSDRARKAEGTGTSEDAGSSQPCKSLSTPAGKCEDGCQSDNERNDKRVMRLNSSDSSTEFALPDSRAQSPSSPLPPLAGEACFSMIAKLERHDATGPLFQKSAPVRPVKKVQPLRKPKIDAKNLAVYTVKHDEVHRQAGNKKVRQPRRQGSSVAVSKLERSSSGTLSAASRKAVGGQPAEPEVNYSEQQALKAVCVKEETMGGLSTGVLKATERSGVKSRPVLSEIEKESRRLRRVQANRESARQTIRKKQLHCEELSHKAAELVSEQDGLKQEYNQKLKEFQQLFEIKRQLKEELAACTGKQEPATVNMDSSEHRVAPSSTPFQFSMLPPPGLMHPYLWSAFAAAMAQEAAKNMVHPHGLSMPAALSAMPMQYPVTCASSDKITTSPVPITGQHSLVRQISSGTNWPSPAGFGAEWGPPNTSKSSGIIGEFAKASGPDMKEIVSRPANSTFTGQRSSAGGKASFMGFSSPFPLGVAGMSIPSLVGSDVVPGAPGSGTPFAFGPGHSANQVTGGLRNSQVAGKLMGMRGPMHGGHYFYDSAQQQAIPMLAAAKPSGAAAAAAAARKRRKELTRSRNVFNRHLARTTSTEVVVPAAVS